MRSDWHLVDLHFLSAFLRWRLALMILLLIQGTLGRKTTFFDVTGAWRSRRRRSVLLYRSTNFSGSALLDKSLRAISSLKALKSKVLSFLKLMCFTVGDGLGAERLHNTEQWSEINQRWVSLELNYQNYEYQVQNMSLNVRGWSNMLSETHRFST